MRVAAIATALLAGFANAATPGDEIKAMRDDIRALCHKVYGGEDPGKKHCRYVGSSDGQRHIVNQCHKSGWSGQGNLQCRYGMEIWNYGSNDINKGDHSVATGANGESRGGRRRVEISEDEPAWGLEGPGELDDVSAGSPRLSFTQEELVTDVFELENLEDEEETMVLKDHVMGKSLCILQGMNVIAPEDPSVTPSCNVKVNERRQWTLVHTSAKCHVMCVPWN